MATERQWQERKHKLGEKAWGAPYLVSRADWNSKGAWALWVSSSLACALFICYLMQVHYVVLGDSLSCQMCPLQCWCPKVSLQVLGKVTGFKTG